MRPSSLNCWPERHEEIGHIFMIMNLLNRFPFNVTKALCHMSLSDHFNALKADHLNERKRFNNFINELRFGSPIGLDILRGTSTLVGV